MLLTKEFIVGRLGGLLSYTAIAIVSVISPEYMNKKIKNKMLKLCKSIIYNRAKQNFITTVRYKVTREFIQLIAVLVLQVLHQTRGRKHPGCG